MTMRVLVQHSDGSLRFRVFAQPSHFEAWFDEGYSAGVFLSAWQEDRGRIVGDVFWAPKPVRGDCLAASREAALRV